MGRSPGTATLPLAAQYEGYWLAYLYIWEDINFEENFPDVTQICISNTAHLSLHGE